MIEREIGRKKREKSVKDFPKYQTLTRSASCPSSHRGCLPEIASPNPMSTSMGFLKRKAQVEGVWAMILSNLKLQILITKNLSVTAWVQCRFIPPCQKAVGLPECLLREISIVFTKSNLFNSDRVIFPLPKCCPVWLLLVYLFVLLSSDQRLDWLKKSDWYHCTAALSRQFEL